MNSECHESLTSQLSDRVSYCHRKRKRFAGITQPVLQKHLTSTAILTPAKQCDQRMECEETLNAHRLWLCQEYKKDTSHQDESKIANLMQTTYRLQGKIILEKKSISQIKREWPFLLRFTDQYIKICEEIVKKSLAEFQRKAADQKLRKSLQRNFDTTTKHFFQRFMQDRKSTRINEVIDSGGVQHISSPSSLKETRKFYNNLYWKEVTSERKQRFLWDIIGGGFLELFKTWFRDASTTRENKEGVIT
ncbi:unnamed protein product [Clavelina lepadiformis]|uniref:Uncharacterized protein n=1 Tax=Clavelina lepadiformis TaxID=159417 RepID=A0ABP0G527_CLALP